MLRNKARTYLFSNSIAPSLVGATIEAYKMLEQSSELVKQLQRNTALFRNSMIKAGFKIIGHR